MQILNRISALCCDSDKFLKNEILKSFVVQMKADLRSLCNATQVLKPMLKDSKIKKYCPSQC